MPGRDTRISWKSSSSGTSMLSATAAACGAPLAWQIATASASAAWSGRGGASSPSSIWTIRATWSLSARPDPLTAYLICCGVYETHASRRCPAASITTPRAWPTANALWTLRPK